MIDCIFVGWPRSGSTWFYEWCRSQPQLITAPHKDVALFSEAGPVKVDEIAWLAKSGNKKAVDIWHDYIFNDMSLAAAVSHNPNINFIVFLRSPLEWVFSEYRYLLTVGEFQGTLREFMKSSASKYIYERVDYAKLLANLKNFTNSANVNIFFLDDLKEDSMEFQKHLAQKIGIDPTDVFYMPGSRRVNSVMGPRNSLTAIVLKQIRKLRDIAVTRSLYLRLKRTRVRSLFFLEAASPPSLSEPDASLLLEIKVIRAALEGYLHLRRTV